MIKNIPININDILSAYFIHFNLHLHIICQRVVIENYIKIKS